MERALAFFKTRFIRFVQFSPMTIYYMCPDLKRAFGGVRMIYRHVDILNEAGFSACVLHMHAPFNCTWFDHDTPVRHVFRSPYVPGVREVVNRET